MVWLGGGGGGGGVGAGGGSPPTPPVTLVPPKQKNGTPQDGNHVSMYFPLYLLLVFFSISALPVRSCSQSESISLVQLTVGARDHQRAPAPEFEKSAPACPHDAWQDLDACMVSMAVWVQYLVLVGVRLLRLLRRPV